MSEQSAVETTIELDPTRPAFGPDERIGDLGRTHFIGIGGAGMSVLAEMLHDKKAQDGQITIIKVPGLGCWRAETIPVEGLRPLLGMED